MAAREYAAYRQAIIQTTDDKKKILLMLYDGAVKFVRNARSGIEENNPKTKGENISKVLAIITELDCALNREMTGGYIENLSSLYQYMMNCLTAANIKNDAGPLTEVELILFELKEAFETAFEKGKDSPNQPETSPGMISSKKEGVSFAV